MKKIRKDAKFTGLIRNLHQTFQPGTQFTEKQLYDVALRTHKSPSSVVYVLEQAQLITRVAEDAEGRHYERTPLSYETAVNEYRRVNKARAPKRRKKAAPQPLRVTAQLYAMAERMESDATFLRRLAEQLAPVEEALAPTDGRT